MQKLTDREMLEARLRRDITYDGKFYVGILSTGIYCLPSCKAKMSKNVIFFENRQKAIEAGFKGCKRCKAEFYPVTEPAWLEKVQFYMEKETSNKLDEKELAQLAKVDITTIRRYFKSRYRVSLMAYHRKLRLARAKRLIDQGVDYKKLPSTCGFKSDSGFRSAFIKEYGHPPGEFYNGRI
ncbi:MAG: Ada metal-binding domain-containing protein [Candidatus Odinarchaeota archaeon]